MTPRPQTITEARTALKEGDYSAAELVESTLAGIERTNPELNAFLEVFGESARAQAQHLDDEKKTIDQNLPLAGIPIAIKDLICTTEGHTTAASKLLKNFRSPYGATVVKKLKSAGAIIIGKTNLDEFAMGSSNEYSAFGPVKNPWDTTRVAGGSSGGSAVAVASGTTLGALGTDTGGSVRMPANFCSVVGLKPTYGRISRFGVIAYASSFDQVGPVTRTVKDNAVLLKVLAGADPQDATTSPVKPVDYPAACGQSLKGLRIGVPKEFFNDDLDAAMRAKIETALEELVALGATLKQISLKLTAAAVPTYYLLVKAEASSNLARFDALRFGELKLKSQHLQDAYREARGHYFGPEVKRSIMMGTYTLSAGYVEAWYKQASKVRTLIRREFENIFKEVDVIAGPVSPGPAFPIGSKADDPLAMYLVDLYTDPASVAGLPAISVPAGFISEGGGRLPVGLQLIAPAFEEARLFQAAHAYEQSQTWWQQTAPNK